MVYLGGRRDRPAAGRRLTWLAAVVLVCGVVCGAPALAAVGYTSHMVGESAAANMDGRLYCVEKYGGFSPNLFNVAQEDELQRWVGILGATSGAHIALSADRTNSLCSASDDCIWQWRGGPLADLPLTFFIGNTSNASQLENANYFYNWNDKFFSEPEKYSYVQYHLRAREGWCLNGNLTLTRYHACEIVNSPTPTPTPTPSPTPTLTPTPTPSPTPTPTPSPTPTLTPTPTPTPTPSPTPTPKLPTSTLKSTSSDDIPDTVKSSSSFPWWAAIITAVVVTVVSILVAVVILRYCRGAKVARVNEEEQETEAESPATRDDQEEVDQSALGLIANRGEDEEYISV